MWVQETQALIPRQKGKIMPKPEEESEGKAYNTLLMTL